MVSWMESSESIQYEKLEGGTHLAGQYKSAKSEILQLIEGEEGLSKAQLNSRAKESDIAGGSTSAVFHVLALLKNDGEVVEDDDGQIWTNPNPESDDENSPPEAGTAQNVSDPDLEDEGEEVGASFSDDGMEAVVTSDLDTEIRTVEDLMAQHGLDQEVWEVYQATPNYWESQGPAGKVGHHQLKAVLRRKVEPDLETCIEDLISRVTEAAPQKTYSPLILDGPDRYMYEMSLLDHHIGMLSWAKETGADYDSDIAESLFHWALEYLANKVNGYPIDKIIFSIGQDMLHTDRMLDGKSGTTTAGTPQDVDSRFQKMADRSIEMYVKALERLGEIAPVDAIWVPGNHDFERSYLIAKVLEGWFAKNDRVDVDVAPTPRKFRQYGNSFIGFTHGKEEKVPDLPAILLHEAQRLGVQADFLEFHHGHIHREKKLNKVVDDMNEVVVRALSSLAPNDAWHSSKGFAHRRSAEAFLWSDRFGPEDSFSANLSPERLEEIIPGGVS